MYGIFACIFKRERGLIFAVFRKRICPGLLHIVYRDGRLCKRLSEQVGIGVNKPRCGRYANVFNCRLIDCVERILLIGHGYGILISHNVFKRYGVAARRSSLIDFGGEFIGLIFAVKLTFGNFRGKFGAVFAVCAFRRVDLNGYFAPFNFERAVGYLNVVVAFCRSKLSDRFAADNNGVRALRAYYARHAVTQLRIKAACYDIIDGVALRNAVHKLQQTVCRAFARILPRERGQFVAVGHGGAVQRYIYGALRDCILFFGAYHIVAVLVIAVGKLCSEDVFVRVSERARRGRYKRIFALFLIVADAVECGKVSGSAALVLAVVGEPGIRPFHVIRGVICRNFELTLVGAIYNIVAVFGQGDGDHIRAPVEHVIYGRSFVSDTRPAVTVFKLYVIFVGNARGGIVFDRLRLRGNILLAAVVSFGHICKVHAYGAGIYHHNAVVRWIGGRSVAFELLAPHAVYGIVGKPVVIFNARDICAVGVPVCRYRAGACCRRAEQNHYSVAFNELVFAEVVQAKDGRHVAVGHFGIFCPYLNGKAVHYIVHSCAARNIFKHVVAGNISIGQGGREGVVVIGVLKFPSAERYNKLKAFIGQSGCGSRYIILIQAVIGICGIGGAFVSPFNIFRRDGIRGYAYRYRVHEHLMVGVGYAVLNDGTVGNVAHLRHGCCPVPVHKELYRTILMILDRFRAVGSAVVRLCGNGHFSHRVMSVSVIFSGVTFRIHLQSCRRNGKGGACRYSRIVVRFFYCCNNFIIARIYRTAVQLLIAALCNKVILVGHMAVCHRRLNLFGQFA